jgi:hypothetical protein
MMVPRGRAIERVDVTAAMDEPTAPVGDAPPPAGVVPAGVVPADMLTGAMHTGGEGP